MVIVGESVIASLKVAVIVTTDELLLITLSPSLFVRETEGAVVSMVKVMLCVPAT